MAATFTAGQAVLLDSRRQAAVTAQARLRVQPFQAVYANATQHRRGELQAQQRRATVARAAVLDAPEAEAESEFEEEGFEERVVQVRRVTKVVKGGKQLSFRAVVVVGDSNGTVGVGCDSAKEVAQAVRKAVTDAKRNLISVPLSRSNSFPHRFEAEFKAAKVMLRPAAEGTGVIAGGAVRVVLELAGVKNGFGKQLGSGNPLNNARATIEGLRSMRTFSQISAMRDIPVAELMGRQW
ncbi:hypothetical protein N2152v2_004502 [Parachlorella kessleri]